VLGTAVREVVAVDRREHDVVEPDLGDRVRDVLGSSESSDFIPPVSTSQKLHPREQRSPMSMNVAVPGPSRPDQHSPMLGQFASSHTVWRSRSRRRSLISVNRDPDGGATSASPASDGRVAYRSHGGRVQKREGPIGRRRYK